jgi:internalin A
MVAKPNRHWYQFSLRTVFVVMTLLALALAAWLQFIEPAERQRAMVRRVERIGGYVRYADAPSDERWPRPTLRHWLPRDYFDALIEINLDATKATITKATDGDLVDLHRHDQLQEVWLNGTEVTDATVKKLSALTKLRVVNLRNTKASDEGLASLAELPQLQILNLRDTKVTGEGLTHLKDLSQLQILNLRNTDVDDAAVESLQGLKQLQSLFLDGTKVSDERKTELRGALPKCDITPANLASRAEQERAKRELSAAESVTNQGGRIVYDVPVAADSIPMPLVAGQKLPHVVYVGFSFIENEPLYPLRLVHLREFPRLRHLDLKGSHVSDGQLAHLAGCTELDRLNLSNTTIGDAGLLHVAALTKLKSLELHNTAVTDAGLARLTDLKNLTGLVLSKTQITDAGLIHLAGLPELQFLGLKDTQVTDAGVENLQRTLPKLTIFRP